MTSQIKYYVAVFALMLNLTAWASPGNNTNPLALRTQTAAAFWQGGLTTGGERFVQVRDYLRQMEKDTGAFDSECGKFKYIGKPIPTPPQLRSLITETLALHHAHVAVCSFQYLAEGNHSDLSGNIFLTPSAAQLSASEFVALLGHELGHRYGLYIISGNDREQELFADACAIWTLQMLHYDLTSFATMLEKLAPRSQGDQAHPGNEQRKAWALTLKASGKPPNAT